MTTLEVISVSKCGLGERERERGRKREREKERESYVIAANMPWYTQNSKSGIRGLATEGAPRVFAKPRFARSPINGPAV